MKKNAGIIAILATVMALFGISNLSKNSSSGPIAAETEKGAKPPGTGTSKSGPVPLVNDSCREILKRLQLFIGRDQLKNWKYLHSCYHEQPNRRRSGKNQSSFIIPRCGFCNCHRPESHCNAFAVVV